MSATDPSDHSYVVESLFGYCGKAFIFLILADIEGRFFADEGLVKYSAKASFVALGDLDSSEEAEALAHGFLSHLPCNLVTCLFAKFVELGTEQVDAHVLVA